jgi:hypothetical protein
LKVGGERGSFDRRLRENEEIEVEVEVEVAVGGEGGGDQGPKTKRILNVAEFAFRERGQNRDRCSGRGGT